MIATFSIVTCSLLVLLMVSLLPILMPMLLILALAVMLLLDAFEAVANAVADDSNADAKLPNVARHLVGAYDALPMPSLMPVLRRLMFVMIIYVIIYYII